MFFHALFISLVGAIGDSEVHLVIYTHTQAPWIWNSDSLDLVRLQSTERRTFRPTFFPGHNCRVRAKGLLMILRINLNEYDLFDAFNCPPGAAASWKFSVNWQFSSFSKFPKFPNLDQIKCAQIGDCSKPFDTLIPLIELGRQTQRTHALINHQKSKTFFHFYHHLSPSSPNRRSLGSRSIAGIKFRLWTSKGVKIKPFKRDQL